MKKRILIFYYSQSGLLFDTIKRAILSVENIYEIIYIEIKPLSPFPFPCSWESFFNVFPESVLQIPCQIEKIDIKVKNDDTIMLGFQPWFLHPSLPINAFMQGELFKSLVKNKNVILFTCSRNTWINTVNIIRNKVQANQGKVISEIIISDNSQDLKSAINFIRWFFTGKKNPFKNIINENIPSIHNVLQYLLVNNNTENIKESASISAYEYEKKIVKYFSKWAHFIHNSKNRHIRQMKIYLFQIWIVLSLIFISPIVKLLINIKKIKL